MPNGGETWQAGIARNIQWSYTGNPGTSVKIELYKAGVLNRLIISSTSTGTNGAGSYNWTVPATQAVGTDYKIMVTSTTNSTFNDISNNNFAIIK
ncbi:MAG: Ser-Thr-rich GPI-anchored membrane family protein [Thermodesulfovibrionales bacterium]